MNRGATGRAARRRGLTAETLAVWRLRLTGWRVLARGFSVGRGSGAGEVDIIARRGGVLAFVEVKTRPTLAEAMAAVRPRQQQRIARAAEAFLARAPRHAGLSPRFDVVALAPGRLPRHIPDAWRP